MASSLLHEELMYLWSQLRLEILKGLGNASSANPNAARLLEVVRAGSTSLGLVAGVEPCLWRSGMHPLLPRDAQLAADQAELLTLCELASRPHLPSPLPVQPPMLQEFLANMDALHAFGSGGVLRLLLTQGGSSADRDVVVILRRLSGSLLRSGRHSPAACAPLTQLAMLLEDGASTAWTLDVQRWQATLIRSLAAEAWQRWLRGLCAEPATSLPGRLHASELTRLVGKIAAGTSVAIGAVDARKAQLSGAAQALLRHRVPNSRAMAVSERAALRAVCAATLTAHSDTIPEDLREAFGAAIHDLLSHDQPAAGDVVSLLAHAVNGSSHSGLRQLWLVCFMPIVQLLAHGEEFADMLAFGKAWALLGLGRLHLCIPPAACDPAAEVSLKRQHILAILQERVGPEQTARILFEQLPGV
ncbi:hypothetical protein F751_3796 [Auxenochlorella protothecoides]|uniref:Uncharacterized protein n=1 Tax=Auxenochlorella protothecoides TaxID=3075 RepID=A0A087SGD0_AUXPR|nr:hypothetical protein F751_3796 [Auxenochlorella protothecoides]KFM24784.1 hypothetical protein F751_3796 [Auxenochlorella protothecoides]